LIKKIISGYINVFVYFFSLV